MVNDVARAFLEGRMRRDICVELPAEAGEGEDLVGHLIMSLSAARATPPRSSRKRSGFSRTRTKLTSPIQPERLSQQGVWLDHPGARR